MSFIKFLKCLTLISYQGNPGALGPRGNVGFPGPDVSYLNVYLRSLMKESIAVYIMWLVFEADITRALIG